jgi:hypothetical protein
VVDAAKAGAESHSEGWGGGGDEKFQHEGLGMRADDGFKKLES